MVWCVRKHQLLIKKAYIFSFLLISIKSKVGSGLFEDVKCHVHRHAILFSRLPDLAIFQQNLFLRSCHLFRDLLC